MGTNIKYFSAACLCMICVNMFAQWTKSMYSQYTYQNYTDYTPFTQAIDANKLDAELLESAIFYETNRQRAKYGLQQLSFDHALCVCAHNHSVDMVEHNFFSHKSPVAGKTAMKDRLSQVGYVNCLCAENIAYCAVKSSYAETARHLVEDVWMNSEGHRRNILNGNYTHLGCGAAFYYEGHWLMVKTTQNFLRK